jgi:hypothetical protein
MQQNEIRNIVDSGIKHHRQTSKLLVHISELVDIGNEKLCTCMCIYGEVIIFIKPWFLFHFVAFRFYSHSSFTGRARVAQWVR